MSCRSIQAEGITPDLIAEQPKQDGDPDPVREEELEGHLAAKPKAKRTGKEKRAPEANGKVPKMFKEDPQGARGYLVLQERMR